MKLTGIATLCAVVMLAACSTPGADTVPAVAQAPSSHAAHSMDTAQGAPADTAQGLPADTAQGLPADTSQVVPADTAQGLPADTAQGLPAANFACAPAQYGSTASCTLAVSTAFPTISNPSTPGNLLPGLHPSDITAAYALPSGGATVAVVDAYDDPNAETELNVFRTTYGLPVCTSQSGCFRKLNQTGVAGAYPSANASWNSETALDIEMVSAACPKCSIVLVEANSAGMDNLGAAADTAAKLRPAAVSNSYYVPEWSGQGAEEVHYNHPGIAIVASAGDQPYPAFPASSPYVTSVGGTTLTHSGSSYTETAWQYGGHGCSKYVTAGKYQLAVTINCGKYRSPVDVSAVADPSTGVSFFSTAVGGWAVAGGTSVGAPIVAAAYALANNAPVTYYPYTHQNGFRVLGGARYAPITGLGSPAGITGF